MREWARGADNRVTLGKRVIKVATDQGAKLKGADIIGVVISARKRVGSDHDTPLDFRAEPLGPRLRKQLDDVADRLLGAVPEMHPVIPGQVARRLAGRDDVIR